MRYAKFAYEDLSPEQFEDLLVHLCRQLFGAAVQKFSTGRDGGRDAKFVGTAERFPSSAEPWRGTTIIQAKHTNAYNKRFSDSDFYSPKSATCILAKELPRLQRLRGCNQVDNYILFSNRRLGAETEARLRRVIAESSQLKQECVFLCGKEQLES